MCEDFVAPAVGSRAADKGRGFDRVEMDSRGHERSRRLETTLDRSLDSVKRRGPALAGRNTNNSFAISIAPRKDTGLGRAGRDREVREIRQALAHTFDRIRRGVSIR